MSVTDALKAVTRDNGVAPGKMLGELIARKQPTEDGSSVNPDVRDAIQARLG